MPLQLSMEGIRNFCQEAGFTGVDEKPNKEEVLEALEICQENNVFEFDGKLYKQIKGHATGQKQAPPVACAWAGLAENRWLSSPQVAELLSEYCRYIDDILSLFEGDRAKCEWYLTNSTNFILVK